MIEKLLKGTENWTYLLIEDNIALNGRILLLSFIKEYLEKQYDVHYIAFDTFPEILKERLPSSVPKLKFHCHDGHTFWNFSESKVAETISSLSPDRNLAAYFNDLLHNEENVLIVVDSLSTLLIHHHPNTICKNLDAIKSLCLQNGTNVKILSLIHSQIHDENVTKKLDYLYSTKVRLKLNPENKNRLSCCISHQKSSGKVIQEEEYFRVNDFSIFDVKRIDRHKFPTTTSDESIANPMADLSFKLTLDDKEKAARDQLILPYTILNSETKKDGGEIIYEADANDDFDEEDPDDDLNI